MKCPKEKCPGVLRVTHTLHVMGESAETRNLKCDCCGFRSTSITVLYSRSQERKKGKGARAVALRIEELGVVEFLRNIT